VKRLGAGVLLIGLAGCATKGQVRLIEGELRSMRVETARRDSVRAADLAAVIRLQQRIMDSLSEGREALRTLERHLAGHPDDMEANYLGVEWTYHLHLSGVVAHTRADDVKLARSYAAAYEKGRGSQMPLIKEWMDFLEGRSR